MFFVRYINRSPQPKINFLGGGAYQRPKKKPLAERIAEKEAKKKQQEEEVDIAVFYNLFKKKNGCIFKQHLIG